MARPHSVVLKDQKSRHGTHTRYGSMGSYLQASGWVVVESGVRRYS